MGHPGGRTSSKFEVALVQHPSHHIAFGILARKRRQRIGYVGREQPYPGGDVGIQERELGLEPCLAGRAHAADMEEMVESANSVGSAAWARRARWTGLLEKLWPRRPGSKGAAIRSAIDGG